MKAIVAKEIVGFSFFALEMLSMNSLTRTILIYGCQGELFENVAR